MRWTTLSLSSLLLMAFASAHHPGSAAPEKRDRRMHIIQGLECDDPNLSKEGTVRPLLLCCFDRSDVVSPVCAQCMSSSLFPPLFPLQFARGHLFGTIPYPATKQSLSSLSLPSYHNPTPLTSAPPPGTGITWAKKYNSAARPTLSRSELEILETKATVQHCSSVENFYCCEEFHSDDIVGEAAGCTPVLGYPNNRPERTRGRIRPRKRKFGLGPFFPGPANLPTRGFGRSGVSGEGIEILPR